VKLVDPAGAKDEYSTPDAGTRFVAVQFRLKNTGTELYSNSPSNGTKIVDNQLNSSIPRMKRPTPAPDSPGASPSRLVTLGSASSPSRSPPTRKSGRSSSP
jgi:hypothetical protein